MARLLEYQAKQILRRFGIPTPEGQIVHTLREAKQAAAAVGYPAMVKAQVRSGKRGKSGGVRAVADETELAAVFSDVMGDTIRGLPVDMLLVERQMEIAREIYAGVTADPSSRTPVMIFCAQGGVDIEETAQVNPGAIHKLHVDVLRGVYPYDALNLVSTANDLTSRQKSGIAQILCRMYEVYRAHDCKLVEINPLALTDNDLVALDARVDIDGDALERQAALDLDIAEEAGERSSTLLEEIAATIDERDHRGTVHFVQIDPDLSYTREHHLIPLGFDCVGAGASLTTMDELVPLGFYPVNFCDTSGNPVGSKLYRVTKLIFSQPGIQGYIFVSCVSSQQLDNTARGIIKALKELYPETKGQPSIPTVLCFRGAWDEDALRLLAEHEISEGRWVRVMSRDATERDAAEVLHTLHQEWTAERESV